MELPPVTIHFIGAGPGAADLITLRAQRLIATAPVCLYAGSLVPPEVLAHCPDGVRRVDTADLDLDQIVAELVSAHAAGLDVARLCSGDPSIFSAVAEQVRRLDAAGVPWDITPGVPAFAAAAAALGRELTVPGVGQSVILTRVAARATPMPRGEQLAAFGATGATLVLHLAVQRIDEVVAELTPHYGAECPVAVVAAASRPDERVLRGRLTDIAGAVRAAGIRRTAVIIVGPVLTADGFCDSHLYSPARDRAVAAPEIRPARADDAGAVTALVRSAYGHYVDRIGRDPAPMLDDYPALIARGDVWVSDDETAILGVLVLHDADDHLLLENIAVAPAVQGRGLGSDLLAFVDAQARARGYREVRLYTHVTMAENIAYYPRHGYVETHRGGQSGYERVFFTKRLDS
jgi:precorrin-4/cobalt-precorrin-4 C11-methyltransferase